MTKTQDKTQDVPQHILYEVEDRVAKITGQSAALPQQPSTPLLFQLDEAIMRAGRDRDVRVIVLSGAGDHWSAGHDLGTPEQAAYKDEHVEDGVRGFFDLTYGSMVETHLRLAQCAEADDLCGPGLLHLWRLDGGLDRRRRLRVRRRFVPRLDCSSISRFPTTSTRAAPRRSCFTAASSMPSRPRNLGSSIA